MPELSDSVFAFGPVILTWHSKMARLPIHSGHGLQPICLDMSLIMVDSGVASMQRKGIDGH